MAENAADQEAWLPIPNHPGYEASNLGRIRSVDRYLPMLGKYEGKGFFRFHKGRILKLVSLVDEWGQEYLLFSARRPTPTVQRVNRMVCWTFNGPPPTPSHQAAHLDGNSLNNAATNLRWCTRLENAAHKYIHGTQPFGDYCHSTIIMDKDVPVIFEKFCQGHTPRQLAEEYGVGLDHLSSILRGRKRADVPCHLREMVKLSLKKPFFEEIHNYHELCE